MPEAPREPSEEDVEALMSDVIYVTYGSAWAFGIDLDAALREIHRAAMDKMNAGVRRADGKILKPPGFVPPDMTEAERDAHARRARTRRREGGWTVSSEIVPPPPAGKGT